MTFVIDYDQLVPIMFFVGLGIGYVLRKVVKKKAGTIARVILFLLIFVIVFLTSCKMFLIGISSMAIALAICILVSSKHKERLLAYMGTLGLTIAAIVASMCICRLYAESQFLALRIVTVGMFYLSLLLTLPITELAYVVRLLFGNSLAIMFLTSFLMFRKIIRLIEDFKDSLEIHERYIKGIFNRILFSIDVLKRRVIPILERSIDDISTSISLKGIDITGYNIKLPLSLKFTMDDALLLTSLIIGILSLVLLCHLL